jgi:phosphatidylserine/phosphatidylglycerophosphate/cardiolipin synthase-like enzyme
MTDFFEPITITTPIALSRTNSATITLPWFVQKTKVGDDNHDGLCEYPPMPASYTPLINGEAAFGAVHDAIVNAKRCVDIVCWGFQPSMFLKRDGQSPCLGDLLIQKGKEGVIVRVLCWSSNAPLTGPISGENNLPGRNTGNGAPEANQRLYDDYWHHGYLTLDGIGQPLSQRIADGAKANRPPDRSPFDPRPDIQVGTYASGYPNVHFQVRDFSSHDRNVLRKWLPQYSADQQLSAATLSLLVGTPSHHQKSIVVDYELPERAVGFVMGHNLLDAYWDTSAHSYHYTASNLGRNVPEPRQDMSGKITGRLLEYLNHNFCQGWQRACGEDLLSPRQTHAKDLKPLPNEGTKVMAQILRTQAQEGRRDIKTLYLQAARNATQFIYIENQYFRWPPLAQLIRELVKRYADGGRDANHPLYLFVVTNANAEGMESATVNTYRMLEGLGRADTIPKVAQLERDDTLTQQYQAAAKEAAYYQQQAQRTQVSMDINNSSAAASVMAANQAASDAQDKAAQLKAQLDANKNQPILATDIPGLKIQMCSLVAPDSPPNDWRAVYVHSKVMVIDDVFITHGSANINTRSMEVDSELNICTEHRGVAQPVRRQLWEMHTNGIGAQDNSIEAFEAWGKIIDLNKKLKGVAPPKASLIEFYWGGDKRTNKD